MLAIGLPSSSAFSQSHSFAPLWKPPFITRLVAEDRCHVNGLAMVDGEPRYVTAGCRSDIGNGWRERRHEGGVLIVDLATGDIVEWIRLEGFISELFDVVAMPGIKCPMALGPGTREIQTSISFEPMDG